MAWNMAWIVVVVTYSMVFTVLMSQESKRKDVPVTCVFSETCVLPCSFQAGEDLVLHWVFGPGEDAGQTVHSYYSHGNQLNFQDPKFKSRTFLFEEQLSRGNASLRLTEVKFQDQGRYKCYTSTLKVTRESFIQLTVEAPVRSVDIKLSDGVLTCSSRDIYPLPNLNWSCSSPLGSQPPVSCEKNAQGLYNINSSLRIVGTNSDIEYVCAVSSSNRTRTATLKKQAPVEGSPSSSAWIFCNLPESLSDPPTFDLEWRFNSQLILTGSSEKAKLQVQESWKDQVDSSFIPGRLQLRKLMPSHEGTYTCDLRSAGNRYVSVTNLRILPKAEHQEGNPALWSLVAILPLCLVVPVVILVCLFKKGRLPCFKNAAPSSANGVNDQESSSEQQTLREVASEPGGLSLED